MRANLMRESVDLDTLIPQYAMNKLELDSYKEICDKENKQIKEEMDRLSQSNYTAGDYTAKISIQNKITMDENKLLTVMKKYNISSVVKTKEYVDMEALENYLYHIDESENKELFEDIDKCRNVKEVTQLRIVKKKGE